MRTLRDAFDSHLNLARKHEAQPQTLAEYYNGKLIAPRRAGEDWFYSNHGYAALGNKSNGHVQHLLRKNRIRDRTIALSFLNSKRVCLLIEGRSYCRSAHRGRVRPALCRVHGATRVRATRDALHGLPAHASNSRQARNRL